MRAETWRWIHAVFLLSCCGPAAANEASAHDYLRLYSDLTARHDATVISLYGDQARVRVSYWKGSDLLQTAELTGDNWRQSLRRGWYDDTNRLEASHFEDVRVAKGGNGQLTIRATRVSDERCYRDSGYAVKVEKLGKGLFRILEERINVQLSASCGRPPQIDARSTRRRIQ